MISGLAAFAAVPLAGCGGGGETPAAPSPPATPAVASVKLLAVGTLAVGERATLAAELYDASGALMTPEPGALLFAVVSGDAVASVTGGDVVALAPGEAQMQASAGGKSSAAQTVRVILRRYAVTDLGALGSGATVPLAINASGQVAGSCDMGDGTKRAFLWTPDQANGTAGSMLNLGLAPGFSSSAAADLNDAAEVVGNLIPASGYSGRAFLWRAGAMQILDLPPSASYGYAKAVNRATQVLMLSNGRPYLWAAGALTNCSGPYSDVVYNIADLNNAGTAVGIFTIGPGAGTQFGWRFDSGRFTSLDRTLPVAINDDGRMITYLQNVPPQPLLAALNNRGQSVGSTPQGAVIVEGGGTYLLDDLLPEGAGWHLTQALAINDRGQIVGTWGTRGLLLTPLG